MNSVLSATVRTATAIAACGGLSGCMTAKIREMRAGPPRTGAHRRAPANAQGFSAFLARPGVSDRVNEMGVRYIVWIDGVTQKTDGGGSIACAAGPGGAGCLGLGWWGKTSAYEATVWDLRQGVSAGTLSTDVKGDRKS